MLRARACCFSLALVALLLASQHAAPALAWGAAGHMVIASLAERALHTLPGGEGVARAVAGALGSLEPLLHNASSFAEAAVWLDRLKAQGVRTFSRWHYVDVPVGSPEALERAGEKAVADDDSALWALKQAVGALRSRKVAAFGASFHLRVLLHVGGDLQQPLHSTSRFSDAHPDGDFGGNSVRLSGLPLPFESERGEWLVAPGRGGGENLHGLWDDGVGALTAVPSKYPPPCETCSGVDSEAAARFAEELLEEYATAESALGEALAWEADDFSAWAQEGHALAVEAVYTIDALDDEDGARVSEAYVRHGAAVARRQLARGGWRLALLLQDLYGGAAHELPAAGEDVWCPQSSGSGGDEGGGGGDEGASKGSGTSAPVVALAALVAAIAGVAAAGGAWALYQRRSRQRRLRFAAMGAGADGDSDWMAAELE